MRLRSLRLRRPPELPEGPPPEREERQPWMPEQRPAAQDERRRDARAEDLSPYYRDESGAIHVLM